MDNNISFKANLITNGTVRKGVCHAFEKATKSFPEETFVLTKGSKAEGMQGYIIADLKSNKTITNSSTSFVFKAPAPDVTDEAVANKLVKGFRVLIEEAMMNQRKYWVEKQMDRTSAIGKEQMQKAEITGNKGLTKISNAYKALAERSFKKADDLQGKFTTIKANSSEKMTEIAGDDKDVQSLINVILNV